MSKIRIHKQTQARVSAILRMWESGWMLLGASNHTDDKIFKEDSKSNMKKQGGKTWED